MDPIVTPEELKEMTRSELFNLVVSLYVIVLSILAGPMLTATFVGLYIAEFAGFALAGVLFAIVYPHTDMRLAKTLGFSAGSLTMWAGIGIIRSMNQLYGMSDEISKQAEDMARPFLYSNVDV
ncbi:hypothetical protein AArc1_2179 [Natrarchaeobaculum sulfurireducens]|uniref:Uncharacterized protein n=1 Tax=Natrarchaeobaculum sulfurireducens TaxID=2044521 RepID=A0A346PG50_9EURY|nr:hypothetical protein AArc1_2179 [Natrarchaeobaculum sulfurireducens]